MALVRNLLLWFIFMKSSFADSDVLNLDVKALQNDVGRIASELQSLQETTRRQDDLTMICCNITTLKKNVYKNWKRH